MLKQHLQTSGYKLKLVCESRHQSVRKYVGVAEKTCLSEKTQVLYGAMLTHLQQQLPEHLSDGSEEEAGRLKLCPAVNTTTDQHLSASEESC